MSIFDNQYGWIVQKRKGGVDSPFVSVSEQITVINGKAFTKEVINDFAGIVISDGIKTFSTKKDGIPDANTVVVDYGNGLIYFDAQFNNKQYTATYKGEGVFFLNAKRVATIVSGDGTVTETLDVKVSSVDTKISEANSKITDMNNKITEANVVISATNTAKANADTATTNATNAANSITIIWKPYVASFTNIASTYPSPQIGWTTQAIDTGIRYRWDGLSWVAYEKVVVVTGSGVTQGTIQPTDTTVLWVDTN